MPIGLVLSFAPALGMWTRLTGGARYRPLLNRSSRSLRFSCSRSSYAAAVTPSTPTAPSLRVRRYASSIHIKSMWCASVSSTLCGASLAKSAIFCCRVEMLSRSNARVICPPRSLFRPVGRFPPAGPLGRVPRARRYYQPTPTTQPPSRRTSLPSLGATLSLVLFAPGGWTTANGPGQLLPRRPHRVPDKERLSPPRFLGDPCVHAVLFDPGGAHAPGRLGARAVVFRPVNDVDSALSAFEAQSHSLHAPCVRFAGGITPAPRNTRFRWMANPYRVRTFTCRVAIRGFCVFTSCQHASPSARLCLAQ